MEKHVTQSRAFDLEYALEECTKIQNIKQALFYMDRGCTLLDIYPSFNYQNGKEILIFLFDREQSALHYPEWVDQRNEANFQISTAQTLTEPNLIRITNIAQVIFYLRNKARLRQCIPARDYRTGLPILAFYFDREETEDIYRIWTSMQKRSD